MALRSRIGDEQTSSLGGWLFADLFLLIMVVGLAGFNITSEKEAPRAITGEARDISKSSTKLTGIVDAGDEKATAFFRWGTSSSLGSDADEISAKESPILAKSSGKDVSAELSGLKANTKYYFRLIAKSTAGEDLGEIRSFKTIGIGPCTDNRFISEPFKGDYTALSARSNLVRDIEEWVLSRKFVEPQVAVALVRGGTDVKNGAGTKGSDNAFDFYNQVLRGIDQPYFVDRTALTSLQNSNNKSLVLFSLELYFVDIADQC
jgi:hypothetical protein